MIREAIVKLVNKENLTYEMAEGAMDEIMGGKADPIQISAFLTAMTMKGETIEEITACANGMRKHGVHMEHDKDVLEIVGTGGDKSNSFNISTTASLVISAGGVAVAKHGNRAASSKSGAADCLEALGVKIDLELEKNKEVLEKLGICFLFAQKYHMSMKYDRAADGGAAARVSACALHRAAHRRRRVRQLYGREPCILNKRTETPLAELRPFL